MRAFLAVNLSAEMIERLRLLQQALSESKADVSWVRPEHLHLTLLFLGDITQEESASVQAAVARTASTQAPFSIQIDHLGVFPMREAPRVIWAGVGPEPEPLMNLAGAVQEAVKIVKRKRIKLVYDDPIQKVESVCKATAANISSMLQDVLNSKRTEIDYINGAITRQGKSLGIPTPVNEVLMNLVKTIESSYEEAKEVKLHVDNR
jgi:2'-5' RNA ligase